jgi:hypothetical protein
MPSGERAGRKLNMPRYAIELIPPPGGSGVTNHEERQFANLGTALQRAREMYRVHESSAIGFRISNAAGELVHEWRKHG